MFQFIDILHIYLGDFYRALRKPKKYYLLGVLKSILYIIKNIFYAIKWGKKQVISYEASSNKIWLLCSSVNNYNSLRFLEDQLNNTIFVTTNTLSLTSDLKKMNKLSFHHSLMYLYTFPSNLLQIFKEQGIFAFKILDAIIEGSGMLQTCEKILEEGQPSAIIFSNDHTIKNRALLLAAKQRKIPTIYLQHASVTRNFPPLKFDLSLLEGQDTYDKYKAIGPIEGTIKLIGMPKFDGYEAYRNQSSNITRIGICSKTIDHKEDIYQLIQFISTNFPSIIVTYRGHPRDERSLKFSKHIQVSDAKKEMIFDFLKQQDLIIAGDTSLHLEATMLNIRSVYYEITPTEGFNDEYGYVKNNLIEEISNEKVLKEYILSNKNTKVSIWKNASHYNATINSEFEGKSQELALKAIRGFLQNKLV